jgi:hypothetical protein
MFFSKREVYTGYSFEQFSNIRNLLSNHNIKHRWRIVDASGSGLGSGNVRAHLGGISTQYSKQYIIYVHKDDIALAQQVIRKK